MPAQTQTRHIRWSPWRLAPGPIDCTCGFTIPLSGWVRGDGTGLHQCGPCGGRPVAPGIHESR